MAESKYEYVHEHAESPHEEQAWRSEGNDIVSACTIVMFDPFEAMVGEGD